MRALYPFLVEERQFSVSAQAVPFSLDWLYRHADSAANPISDIQFLQFMNDRENEIASGIRKRMFDKDDKIRLKPDTIEAVVKRLENIYLLNIDADLNGRLFETFLNATMRGKDLGQFFTPRSLVKLGVRLADLQVALPGSGHHTDFVVDACCGTGGFLIDTLAAMWEGAGRLPLGSSERAALENQIANHHIVGIDVANDPNLARIARLNMYLHGDGGSRIYHVNALDKELSPQPSDDAETVKEKIELRALISDRKFDVALTNPPFAKAVDKSSKGDIKLLSNYEIAQDASLSLGSIRSNLLFIERYWDLLRVGGRLITILDDGILSGDEYKAFRAKFRSWYNIRAIVSLPGDAFQRSNARVKTSYVVAEKRDPEAAAEQGPVFMYACRYVGLDDPKRQRARATDALIRREAIREIEEVGRQFDLFKHGRSTEHLRILGAVEERIDVKYWLFKPGRLESDWQRRGQLVFTLDQMASPRVYRPEHVISGESEEAVRVLIVRYNGSAEEAEQIVPSETTYSAWFPVQSGDIVISNIAASYGSVAVVPEELDGAVVSSEYTVLCARKPFQPRILQLILRSPEIRSDILLSASGANRTRTRWSLLKDLKLTYPSEREEAALLEQILRAERSVREARRSLHDVSSKIVENLELRSPEAEIVLEAFKPPK